MAKRRATPKVTSGRKVDDGHAHVSNESAETAAATRPVSQPPGEGTAPDISKPGADGIEVVSGYRRVTPAAVLESMPELEKQYRDIGEASFGPPPLEATLETVIGTDDRRQITNTAAYPWRVHCSLAITAADGSQWIGTAWFISPRTLMTAGHCVFIKNSGVPGRDGWVTSIRVMPGRNGTTMPFGSVVSSSFRAVKGWTQDGDPNFDYGAIILPSNLGSQTGWFGFGVYADADLVASVANISGYPGDKPAGTQWYHARKTLSVNTQKVFYDVDTFGGQSGSAVYRTIGGQRYALAIHAYGVGGGVASNSGTRITRSVYDNMVRWKA
jgi:glutamyl endopeptidase